MSKVCIIEAENKKNFMDFLSWKVIVDGKHLAMMLAVLSCSMNHPNRPSCKIGGEAVTQILEKSSILKLIFIDIIIHFKLLVLQ